MKTSTGATSNSWRAAPASAFPRAEWPEDWCRIDHLPRGKRIFQSQKKPSAGASPVRQLRLLIEHHERTQNVCYCSASFSVRSLVASADKRAANKITSPASSQDAMAPRKKYWEEAECAPMCYPGRRRDQNGRAVPGFPSALKIPGEIG